MPKYNDSPFTQLSRSIFHEDCKLSYKAKWLYCVLSELEHRYTGHTKCDFFFRTQSDIKTDTGMNLRTIRAARIELIDSDYITTWQMHWINDNGSKSEKHVTAYKLIK